MRLRKLLPQRQTQAGQEVVEFALILPVLILLLLGIIEFGVLMYSYNSIAHATREGARVGVIGTASTDMIIDAVLARTPLALTRDDVTVTLTADRVDVQVDYDVRLMTGAIIEAVGGNPMVHLRTMATMLRE